MYRWLSQVFGGKRRVRRTTHSRRVGQAWEVLERRALLATLSINSPPAVIESDGEIQFTVTLTGAATGPFYAGIVIEQHDTATHKAYIPGDFADGESMTRALYFAGTAGETKTFTLELNNENRVEYTEQFQARIAAVYGGGVTIGTGIGTGTITNDDSATISLIPKAPGTGTSFEGEVLNPGKVEFTVRSSAPIDEALKVDWSTADGSAVAGQDYVANNGSLPFGSTRDEGYYTSEVDFIGDARVETELEDFRVNLGTIALDGGGACLLPVTVAAGGSLAPRIEDEDTAVVTLLPIFDATEGTHISRVVTVELTGDVDTSFSVAVSTAAGTASGGQDYTTLGGHVLTFSGTDGEKEVCALFITNDNLVEAATEDLSVYLHDPPTVPAGYAGRITVNPGGASRTVTITDEDVAALSINNQSAAEEMPDGAMRIFYFTVTLTKAFDQGMTLHYNVYGQTANGDDVVGGFGSRSVDIAAGATSVVIEVRITQDSTFEPDETFVVDLQDVVPTTGSSPRAFTFTDDEGIGTIVNND